MYYFAQHCLQIKARSNNCLEADGCPWGQKTSLVVFKNLPLAFSAALASQLLWLVNCGGRNPESLHLEASSPRSPQKGKVVFTLSLPLEAEVSGLPWPGQFLLIPCHSYGADWDAGKHFATHICVPNNEITPGSTHHSRSGGGCCAGDLPLSLTTSCTCRGCPILLLPKTFMQYHSFIETGPFLALTGLEKCCFTEYFTPCLKFDDSSQLCAALSSEPNATSGIVPGARSVGAPRQEPVCLVQTEGVAHQPVRVTFSNLLV